MTSAAREGDAEPGNTSHRLLLAIDKPNVLLFLADDLGVGDVKASGYVDKNGTSTTMVSILIMPTITLYWCCLVGLRSVYGACTVYLYA